MFNIINTGIAKIEFFVSLFVCLHDNAVVRPGHAGRPHTPISVHKCSAFCAFSLFFQQFSIAIFWEMRKQTPERCFIQLYKQLTYVQSFVKRTCSSIFLETNFKWPYLRCKRADVKNLSKIVEKRIINS